MFCHLLTGSATTSQSAQADWRSLAKVDFPTADLWRDILQETTSWQKYSYYSSHFEILYSPIFPSMETLLTLALPSSAELERSLKEVKLLFPVLLAIVMGLGIIVFPTRKMLLAVVRCRGDALYLMTCIKHVCFFNLETGLNRIHRCRPNILAWI